MTTTVSVEMTPDKLLQMISTSERVLATVSDLAARWHRHDIGVEDHFGAGLRAGWAQSIALLTGVEYSAVWAQLRAGEL